VTDKDHDNATLAWFNWKQHKISTSAIISAKKAHFYATGMEDFNACSG
jgi:hypothetical protein